MAPDKKRELNDMIDEAVKSRIDANRRFIDEVLEKIQDQNRQYFLAKLGEELRQTELQQKAGNLQVATHHRVMADVYKSILERCFCSYRIILRRRYKLVACLPCDFDAKPTSCRNGRHRRKVMPAATSAIDTGG